MTRLVFGVDDEESEGVVLAAVRDEEEDEDSDEDEAHKLFLLVFTFSPSFSIFCAFE